MDAIRSTQVEQRIKSRALVDPKTYLRNNEVHTFVDDVVQSLITDQPQDPYSYIMRRCAQQIALANEKRSVSVQKDPLQQCDSGRVPPLTIVILIVGSRGDVQPFLALAKGLQGKGHRVRIATHLVFKDFVKGQGVDFFPIGGDPATLMSYIVKNPDMISFSPQELAEQTQTMWDIYSSTYSACTIPTQTESFYPDIIIANPPTHVHIHLAEKLQVPLHVMFTMPWSPTDDYKHPMATYGSGTLYSARQSYRVVEEMIWMGLGGTINRFRTDVLQLPSIRNGACLLDDLNTPHTYCMSPHLAVKPSDWGPHIEVVGFWFLDLKTNFDPLILVPDLVEFLEGGAPPFYVGFGSIVVDNPKELSRKIITGIQNAGIRAIVHQGWAKLGADMDVGPNIFLLDAAVPHDWLLPKCSIVCHHGGAGTTASGLRAGKPTIVVPFFGDQPFWGSMVEKAGVGPNPIPHDTMTPQSLADAIQFCSRPEVVARAQEMGVHISSEDGVEAGIKAFEKNLPMKDGKWICSYFENQRWYPVVGWTSKMLRADSYPFSDQSGCLLVDSEKMPLPKGWAWDGPWEVDENFGGDEEGWMYALNWDKEWSSETNATNCVRRRRWIRSRTYNYDTPPEAVAKDQLHHLDDLVDVMLFLNLKEARGLRASDAFLKSSDPFVQLCVMRGPKRTQVVRSKIIERCLSPKWNQSFFFRVRKDDVIHLSCYDYDSASSDDMIGVAQVQLDSVALTTSPTELTLVLEGIDGPQGEVLLSMNL